MLLIMNKKSINKRTKKYAIMLKMTVSGLIKFLSVFYSYLLF